MNSIGDRLREERIRLGLSQDEFAAVAGVQRRAQGNYERGERAPDAVYLASVAARGADIQYIVCGIRTVPDAQHQDDLKRMSDAWETLELALEKVRRTLPPSKKRKAAEALYRASKAQVSGVSQDQLTALVLELAA